MPLKKGKKPNPDYEQMKDAADNMEVGQTFIYTVAAPNVSRKYVYEIGLKHKPRREFSTKKLSATELRVSRII